MCQNEDKREGNAIDKRKEGTDSPEIIRESPILVSDKRSEL